MNVTSNPSVILGEDSEKKNQSILYARPPIAGFRIGFSFSLCQWSTVVHLNFFCCEGKCQCSLEAVLRSRIRKEPHHDVAPCGSKCIWAEPEFEPERDAAPAPTAPAKEPIKHG
jgi:hypothetical protein